MQNRTVTLDAESLARRAFLKRAGTLAATAPAVALLLNASATPARAQNRYDMMPVTDPVNNDPCTQQAVEVCGDGPSGAQCRSDAVSNCQG